MLCCCLLLGAPVLFAQQLVITDASTGELLEGVAAFTPDRKKSALSNGAGVLSLEPFVGYSAVRLQLYGYRLKTINPQSYATATATITLTADEENLSEVILSVARSRANRNQLAEKVALISAETIQKNLIKTGAEVLALTPGVRIQKSQGGGGSPVLRGFEANRVLLVVDGVRMNNAIYRSGHLQNAITIDPNVLERVEVIFGSSSVGYGSDALGGVVHYYTKTPKLNSEKKIETTFSSGFNSGNTASVNNFTTTISGKKWGSISSFSFSNFGDIRMGANRRHGYENWGLTPMYSNNTEDYYNANPVANSNPNIQRNTGYKQYDFFQKAVYQLPNNEQLLFNFQLSTSSNIDRFDKLSETRDGQLRFAEWYYGPQNRLLAATTYNFFKDKRWMKKGRITLAYQRIGESRNKRKFNSLVRATLQEQVNLVSLNADFDATTSNRVNISYGFEATYNHVYSRGFNSALQLSGNTVVGLDYPQAMPSRYPSKGSELRSVALYTNWVWNLSPKLTVNAGGRLNFSALNAQWKPIALIDNLLSEVKLNSEALTWTLAGVFKPKPGLQWNLILSSGFKAPNIDDIGKIRENNGVLLVPNSFLQPEYAYNLDFGLLRFSPNKKNQLSLRSFLTLVSRHMVRSDYTVFADTSTPNPATILYNGDEVFTVANKNLGNRWVYGGTLDGQLQLSANLKLDASVMLTKGDKNEKYGPLPSLAPLFGRIQATYTQARWDAALSYQFSGSKLPEEYSYGGEDGIEETPIINPSTEDPMLRYAGTPAWGVTNFLVNFKSSEQLRFQAGLENIFDLHYRTFASGISAPGRSVQLGLRYNF